MNLWEMYKAINLELHKDFLCIPPYRCVTGKIVGNLYEALNANIQIAYAIKFMPQ